MKASELIKKLQSEIEVHGDAAVVVWDSDSCRLDSVDSASYYKKEDINTIIMHRDEEDAILLNALT